MGDVRQEAMLPEIAMSQIGLRWMGDRRGDRCGFSQVPNDDGHGGCGIDEVMMDHATEDHTTRIKGIGLKRQVGVGVNSVQDQFSIRNCTIKIQINLTKLQKLLLLTYYDGLFLLSIRNFEIRLQSHNTALNIS